jgi:AraC family transcriptional regulator
MNSHKGGISELQVRPFERIIHDEPYWIASPRACDGRHSPERILASRWTGSVQQPRESVAETDGNYHVVAVAVRTMNLTVFAAQRLIHNGRMAQGSIHVNRPGQSLRAIFRSCYDVLHLHVPNDLIAGFLKEQDDSIRMAEVFSDPVPFRDPIVEGLAQALIRAEDCGDLIGPSYTDGVGLAIVTRLLARQLSRTLAPNKSAVSPLAKWRLRRVMDFIDAHLADPIDLADLAAAAGLSPMHFAAQFRAATGARPREYLLRRRIEQAQVMLRNARLPLCEVALDVGFKSQAHFTTVFGRFTGQTPNVWRNRFYGMAQVSAQ